MNGAGRQQIQAGMQMFVVVPVNKFNDEPFRIFDTHEVLRIHNPALHRRKDAFGKGVVVARVRPAVT